jgi:uncharacterized membrane protein YhaH (DUF805 family)
MELIRKIAVFIIRRFTFFGRAARLELLCCFLVQLGLTVLFGKVEHGPYPAIELTVVLLLLVSIVANLATAVRRLHDLGGSGFWLLVGVIPFANMLLTIRLLAGPGTPGPNKYDHPRQGHRLAEVF